MLKWVHAFHEGSACIFEDISRSLNFLYIMALGDSSYREVCRCADRAAYILDLEIRATIKLLENDNYH